MESKERVEGYYWVKIIPESFWRPLLYQKGRWHTSKYDTYLKGVVFSEINEVRIPEPLSPQPLSEETLEEMRR